MPKAEVWLYGIPCGDIISKAPGRDFFLYRESYSGPPLSVSFPQKRARPHHASPWLENLLPESPALLQAYASRLGVSDSRDSLALCERIGFDLPGAVELHPKGEREDALRRGASLSEPRLTEEEVGELMLTAKSPGGEQRYSISGFQDKIALRKEGDSWYSPNGILPTTHILKPAMPSIGRNQPHLELFTQRVAELSGFEVAKTEVSRFGDVEAVVSTRFDRVAGERIHQEDLCQVLKQQPKHKYPRKYGNVPTTGRILNAVEEHTGEGREFLE